MTGLIRQPMRAARASRSLATLFALALAMALAMPASAYAFALRIPATLGLTDDVAIETTATDPAGLGLLYVDGYLAASVAVTPSEPATFAAVPFEPGPHVLRVVLRSRSGAVGCDPMAVECWGTPAKPKVKGAVRGLYPGTVTLPVEVAGANRLYVYVDGRCEATKTVRVSDTVSVTFPLGRAGEHKVELRAANPVSSASTSLALTRPVWPTPGYTRVTSPFGWRYHPILGTRRLHKGLDIGAPYGARVVATGAGTILSAGVNGGYGNCIVVDHGGGVLTLHGHLSRIDVRPGQRVSLGQRIGLVGSTGLSTGPHLHYEILVDGVARDPLGYL